MGKGVLVGCKVGVELGGGVSEGFSVFTIVSVAGCAIVGEVVATEKLQPESRMRAAIEVK